jgi:hypothetical protein
MAAQVAFRAACAAAWYYLLMEPVVHVMLSAWQLIIGTAWIAAVVLCRSMLGCSALLLNILLHT